MTYYLCQTGAEPRVVGTTKKAAADELRSVYKLYLAGGWKVIWGNARDMHYTFQNPQLRREAVVIKAVAS